MRGEEVGEIERSEGSEGSERWKVGEVRENKRIKEW